MTKLSDTQLIILSSAAQRDDGLVPVPDAIKVAGQRAALVKLALDGFVAKTPVHRTEPAWFKPEDEQPIGFKITNRGLEAIGLAPCEPQSENLAAAPTQPPVSAEQPGSKIASVLARLGREGGVSAAELMQLTGWQAHSTRAALTGLRKKGHLVEKRRSPDGPTVYFLPARDLRTEPNPEVGS